MFLQRCDLCVIEGNISACSSVAGHCSPWLLPQHLLYNIPTGGETVVGGFPPHKSNLVLAFSSVDGKRRPAIAGCGTKTNLLVFVEIASQEIV